MEEAVLCCSSALSNHLWHLGLWLVWQKGAESLAQPNEAEHMRSAEEEQLQMELLVSAWLLPCALPDQLDEIDIDPVRFFPSSVILGLISPDSYLFVLSCRLRRLYGECGKHVFSN